MAVLKARCLSNIYVLCSLAPLVSYLITVMVCMSLLTTDVVSASMDTMDQDKLKSAVIDVRPGAGRQEFEQSWGQFRCKFEYKSQGGTNEQWTMVMAKNKKGIEWLCVVERPSGTSYLFFEEFKLQVFGADLQETLVESKEGVRLRNEEYLVVRDDNYVKQWDKFNSQLTRVQIYATSKKRLSTKEL